MKFTGKQILSGISFAVGIAGFVLSIYFYIAQKQFKALSFIVDPKRTLLVSPRITLFDRDGEQIRGDVYSAELYLWNSGTQTILGSDVLVPLTVSIPGGARLLDLRPVYVARPSVTQTSASIQKRPDGESVEFRFRVLEPGDGITTLLLYEGPADMELSLKGGITGIREITESVQIIRDERWFAPWKENAPLFLGVLLVGVMILAGLGWKFVSQRFFPTHARKIQKIAMGSLFVVYLGYLAIAGILTFLEPWRHPEKVIRQNIRNYIPAELTKH